MSSTYFETNIKDFVFKEASEEDIPVILGLINELAVYEHLEEQVIITDEELKESLCNNKLIECFIAVYQNIPVGYILTFYNFSTFLGKPGLYLEDLFIKPAYRKKGFGKAALKFLAKRAVEKGCGRFEWTCLDWNEPSRKFYESMGAVPMKEWIIYRLTGDRLQEFSEEE